MAFSLTVAALQTELFAKNESRAVREAIGLAKKTNARLICLPEHWLLDKVLTGDDDPLYGQFKDLASSLGAYINLGGIFEKEEKENKTYFLSPTISPEGEIVSKQKKVHLFRRENDLAIGGDSFDPFRIDDISTGVMVCHDVVFPESARTLVLKGVELLLNPSLIPARGISPWRTYIMARALENRVPIIATNPYLGSRVPGKSVLFGLSYEKKQGIMEVKELAKPLTGKRAYVVEISFDEEFAALRKERLDERKPKAYFKE